MAEHVVPSTEPSRVQIEALATDLPALWAAPSTAHRDRKRLLRALIADVTLTSKPHSRELLVGIRWRSGAAEEHAIERPLKPADAQRTPSPAVELIRRLSREHHTNTQIAEQLNAAGFHIRKGGPFEAKHVQWIRWRHKIPYPATWAREGEPTVDQIAEHFHISTSTVYDWISAGDLAARRGPGNRLYIPLPPEVEQQCRERIQNSVHLPAETKNRAAGGAV